MSKHIEHAEFEIGFLHMREDPGINVHRKQISKAFHKWGKTAPEVLRLHLVARLEFPQGYFSVNEMAQVLTDRYGFSMRNRGSIYRLEILLRGCEWFRETAPRVFTFKSWRKITGRKRWDREIYHVDREVLTKQNKRIFVDTLINVQASGQIVPTMDICNQTGYNRSRVFQALQWGRENGFYREQVKALVPGCEYDTETKAQKARYSFYREGILTDVIKVKGKFLLTCKTGNNFRSLTARRDGGTGEKPGTDKAHKGRRTRNGHVFRVQEQHFSNSSFTLAVFADAVQFLQFVSRHKTITQGAV